MKRSTLTLSILTAILLTACGGSDDHTDHTTDTGSKPPKVTTPTTGTDATEDKGTSGGGGHGSGHSEPSANDKLTAADKAVENAKAAVTEAQENLADKGAIFEARKKVLGDLDSNDPKYEKTKKALEEAEKAVKEAREAVDAAKNAEEEAKNQQKLAKLDVAIEQADHPAEKEAKKAEKAVEEANQAFLNASTAATSTQLASDEAQKNVEIAEQALMDAGREKIREEKTLLDLQLDLLQNPNDQDNQKAVKEAKEKLADATARFEKAKKQKQEADAKKEELDQKKKAAEKVLEDAQEKLATAKNNLEKAKEVNKYRSVAGSEGSSDASFVEIVKVEKKDSGGKWLLTFAGDDKATEINPTKQISTGASYGSFGFDDKNQMTAAKQLDQSIYGYITDAAGENYKFFSAGEVSDPSQLTGTAAYAGTALLKENGVEKGGEMVAKVDATASFDTNSFGGSFTEFKNAKYAANGVELSENKELSEVKFKAKIDGNKFTPSADGEPSQAKVYGHFYGTSGTEVGGLVEHDKFHGSFGGRKESTAPATAP